MEGIMVQKDVLKVKISITLDKAVLDGVQKLAEEDERSISSYINKVLKEKLRKEAEK